MKIYLNTFKYTTYYMLLISLLLVFFSLSINKPIHMLIFTLNFFLWILAYNYLKKQTQIAFLVSYILVNILWLPLLYQTIRRILFVLENGGMERADGYGSPLAFLLGLIFEQIFFIPLTILFIFGLLFIVKKGKI